MPDEFERLRSSLQSRYSLRRVIGRGGMATVYLADDVKHGRRVAIKVLRAELSSSLATQRFKKEISIAAGLAHPHIVPLLDSGEAEGLLFYSMPHVEGETLAMRLAREGPLATRAVLQIARDVADALEYAHGRGIIHRDIKPENILLTSRHAVITDFGVARAIEAASHTKLTGEHSVLGTPVYMSPEQAAGEEQIDERSDLYSLGCVIYEMLAGEPPFAEGGVRAVLTRKVLESPSLAELGPQAPRGLVQLLEVALERSPENRHQSASSFIEALDRVSTEITAGRRASGLVPAAGTRITTRRARIALGGVTLAILGGTLWAAGLLDRGAPTEGAFVVLPFHTATVTEREDSLAAAVADELTRQLNSWEGIVAVTQVALTGPMFDLGLAAPFVEDLADAYRISEAVGAQTLIGISVRARGDSALVTAEMFDAGRRGFLRRARHALDGDRVFTYGGLSSDLFALASPVTGVVLGVDGSPDELGRLQRYTSDPEALSHFELGKDLLGVWQLGEAEAHLRSAIDADSTFALAYHYLAVALYWDAEVGSRSLRALGPEIGRLATTASMHAARLPEVERQHVRAFDSFMRGEYETAREIYRGLLDRDSTDVYAWLLLGSVEYTDPWLTMTATGLLPRRNLNVAVRAFTNAVRISPAFDLGYGQLFEIHELIVDAVENGTALGFERPSAELILPWDIRTPTSMMAFFPIVLDSIVWLNEEREPIPDSVLRTGAQRLEDQIYRQLERWVRYSPNAVRPHEVLTSWVSLQLSRLPEPSPPERIRALAETARAHASRALALSRDTSAASLYRLSTLHLAAGDVTNALSVATAAQERDNDGPRERRLAGNAYLATGQIERLLALDIFPGQQRYVTDSSTGRRIPHGAGRQYVERLTLLGALGIDGDVPRRVMALLMREWNAASYSDADRLLLRMDATRWVAPAVVTDRVMLEEWTAGFPSADPLVEAFLLADSPADLARERLHRAVAAGSSNMGSAARAYLIGLAAHRIGDHELAARSFSRLDSIPPQLESLDPLWGFRTVSYELRRRSYEALGQSAAAQQSRQLFEHYWTMADSVASSSSWAAGVER